MKKTLFILISVFILFLLFTNKNTYSQGGIAGKVEELRRYQNNYYLIIYKHDTYREPMKTYDFHGRVEFISWPDSASDELSSFEFRLPSGWGVEIYKHRNPGEEGDDHGGPYWGNGEIIKINKDKLPWNDEASAHKWVRR
jgi:hypothetical protein